MSILAFNKKFTVPGGGGAATVQQGDDHDRTE